VAYWIAPYQNGMVAIMIPQIRFSDRPLSASMSDNERAVSWSYVGDATTLKSRSAVRDGDRTALRDF
jgi:hypothetical protein